MKSTNLFSSKSEDTELLPKVETLIHGNVDHAGKLGGHFYYSCVQYRDQSIP